MDSQYDMTTLDAEHRMDIFVVIGELDPSTITIHDDSNIGEIRDTISKKLKVPIEDQGSLVCINNNGEVCNVELTKEDAENGKKMTEYDPPIVKGAVFNLEVSDAFDLKIIERHQSIPREQAPKAPSMDDSEAHMRPTSIQGEKQRQKRAKKQARSFHQQQDREQQKHKQQRQQMRQQQAQQAQQQQQRRPQGQQVQQGLNIQSHRGYHPNQQQLALYAKIQKHSKTHCRLLFVLMEIQLILLIVRWGGLDMILYLIAIFFALCGFRGCRKLHPLWILAFLLWLLLEILLICLYIIAALIETHESIYGSVGAYVGLLSFELVLNVIWAWYYFKFLRMVLSMGLELRAWGEIQMKQTVVFC